MDREKIDEKEASIRKSMELKALKQKEEEEFRLKKELTKKKLEKAIKKRTAKPFWKTYGDYFAYAGLGIVVITIIIFNFTGDRRKLTDIVVNEEEYIQAHNESKQSFDIGRVAFFEGLTLAKVKDMTNNQVTNKKQMPRCNTKAIDSVVPPESFNFYTSHPKCRFDDETKKCSGSYVEAATAVFRNRYCLYNGGKDFIPSTDYLFSCDTKNNKGCKSGYVFNSLKYMTNQGMISQGCWENHKGKTEGCPPAENFKSCEIEKLSGHCVLEGAQEIKKEVFRNGPVVSAISPYRDLLVYKSGEFDFEGRNRLDGLFFVKIIGWGFDSNKKEHWIIDPLWGFGWGDGGVGKIQMGHEESFLDKFAITLYPTFKGQAKTAEKDGQEKSSDEG